MSRKPKIPAGQTKLPLFGDEDAATPAPTPKHNSKPVPTDLMKAVAIKTPVRRKIDRDFPPEVATEIRQKLKEKKAAQSPEAIAKTEAERERREKIIHIKKIAREMEKGNNSKIILFPSYSRHSDKLEWYKMGDFSALYYVYRMADRMGRSARILKDTDKFARMNGVVSIRDIDKFLDQTKQMNEFERHEQTLDGIYIVYFKRPLDPDELGALRRTESERKKMMHNVLRPKKANPAVYQAILDIDRQVLPRTAKMEKGYAVTIGNTMATAILELTETYFKMAKGYLEPELAKAYLLELVERIKAGTALLGENAVWSYDVASSVGVNLVILEEAINKMV